MVKTVVEGMAVSRELGVLRTAFIDRREDNKGEEDVRHGCAPEEPRHLPKTSLELVVVQYAFEDLPDVVLKQVVEYAIYVEVRSTEVVAEGLQSQAQSQSQSRNRKLLIYQHIQKIFI